LNTKNKAQAMTIETPITKEEIIIKATCIHYGLDVKHFTESRATDFNSAYQRSVCIHLIKENTFCSYKSAGSLLNISEYAAKSGAYKIVDLLTIEKRTINDIKEIKIIIDSFTELKKKLSASCIPSNNITH
jgi:hypothetical protein